MIAWVKGILAVVKASSWLASALKIGALVVGAAGTVVSAITDNAEQLR